MTTPTDKTGSVFCTLGVGDGSGNLFVHGEIEAIARAQALILRMEKLETAFSKAVDLLEELRPHMAQSDKTWADGLLAWYKSSPRP